MNISIVIPTINSSRIIKGNLLKIRQTLEDAVQNKIIEKFEIVVAAQTSRDNTFSILNSMRDEIIKPVFIKQKGKGVGLTNGIKKANYKWVLMIDDDIPYDIMRFLKLASEHYAKEADIIIASRYVRGGKYESNIRRRIASSIYRLLIKIFFGIPQKDIQAGMKLIKKELFQKIRYPKEHGYIWDTELLYNANKKKTKIVEIPVTLENPEKNQLNVLKSGIGMLKDIIRLRIRM